MRESASNALGLLIIVAVSVASGVLGGIFYVRAQDPPPRVLVVDMRRLVQRVAADPSLDEASRQQRAAALGTAVVKAIDTQAANGAIVLDASAVLRAPKDVYVEP